MKYYTSAIVLVALLGAANLEQSQAVKLGAGFTDDLVKSLAEDMQKDAEGGDNQEQSAAQAEEPKAEEKKPEKKAEKKTEAKKPAKKDDKKAAKKDDKKKDSKKETKPAKKEVKKEEETEIPMDQSAIKAYSSVIADAAEDSEPASPVQYHAVMQEEEKP